MKLKFHVMFSLTQCDIKFSEDLTTGSGVFSYQKTLWPVDFFLNVHVKLKFFKYKLRFDKVLVRNRKPEVHFLNKILLFIFNLFNFLYFMPIIFLIIFERNPTTGCRTFVLWYFPHIITQTCIEIFLVTSICK